MSDSSSGQRIGAVAGAVIGGILTGGSAHGIIYGLSIGFSLGGMIDPPEIKTDDDLLDPEDIRVPTFQHNVPVPIVYGTYPVAGNVMFIGRADSELIKVDEVDVPGGKGQEQDIKERWYDMDFAMGLSEGEIREVLFVYKNQIDVSEYEGDWFTIYTGTATQTVAPQVIDAVLADGDVPWRNTAYLMWHGMIGSVNSLPIIETYVNGIYTTVEETGSNSLTL